MLSWHDESDGITHIAQQTYIKTYTHFCDVATQLRAARLAERKRTEPNIYKVTLIFP